MREINYIIELKEIKCFPDVTYFKEEYEENIVEADDFEKAKVYFSEFIAERMAEYISSNYDYHTVVKKIRLELLKD